MGSAIHGSVSVHALSAGYLTLPEAFFISPVDDSSARKTVPSLSFLIQHVDPITSKTTRLVFDLGIRRVLADYAAPIYKHVLTREPVGGEPDAISSLAKGGLTPDDIDMVVFSHLHWDHVGTPSEFSKSAYVVGPGAAGLIDGSNKVGLGSHNHFEQGLLDSQRLVQLPPTRLSGMQTPRTSFEDSLAFLPETRTMAARLFSRPWQRIGLFEAAMDIFGDGSLYAVSAPGHLDGHLNLLCRLSSGKYVYLAGDSCHDTRLLHGTKSVATWIDEDTGGTCCIHKDKTLAERTISVIRDTMRGLAPELGQVEVVLSHDVTWEQDAKKAQRFFPGEL
jgi:glyoxylase-like metal-dependent hydrolase (beta-lactamase superfamily II)